MRFYGLDDEQVFRMSIRRFWLLNANIDRISAQENYRNAQVAMTANMTKESIETYFKALQAEIGTVVVREETPDYEGITKLKTMAAMFK